MPKAPVLDLKPRLEARRQERAPEDRRDAAQRAKDHKFRRLVWAGILSFEAASVAFGVHACRARYHQAPAVVPHKLAAPDGDAAPAKSQFAGASRAALPRLSGACGDAGLALVNAMTPLRPRPAALMIDPDCRL